MLKFFEVKLSWIFFYGIVADTEELVGVIFQFGLGPQEVTFLVQINVAGDLGAELLVQRVDEKGETTEGGVAVWAVESRKR